MAVVVVSRTKRPNGTTQVVLSQDGVRFTMVVPDAVDEAKDALDVYQIMADRQCAEQQRLNRIAEEGRRF